MASEWAMKKALESPVFKEAANRSAISDAEYESFMRDFAEALDAARAAALEAGIADSLGNRYDEACKRAGMISIMSSGCFNAAAEIRARIDKEPTA